MFLRKGVCDRCSADEIIAFVGRRQTCKRCDSRSFIHAAATQKMNYIEYGSVYGKRKKFQKNAS
jgi:ribosomal protein S27AE